MTATLPGQVSEQSSEQAAPEDRTGLAAAAVATVVVALSVVLAGRLRLELAGLVAVAAVLTAANRAITRGVGRAAPGGRWARVDPKGLALAYDLALFVGFPFGHLAQDRTTSYVVVLAVGSVSLSGLGRPSAPGRGGGPTPAPRGQALLCWLFGALTVSSVLSPEAGAVKFLVGVAAAAVPIFLLAGRLDRAGVVTAIRIVVVLALTESAVAVVEPWVFPRHLWAPAQLSVRGVAVPLANTLLPGLERSQGTLGHPLQLSLLLLVALALLVRRLPDLSDRVRHGAQAATLLGLLFTGSRSGVLAAVLVLLVGRRLTYGRVLTGVAAGLLAVGGLVSAGRLTAAPLTTLLNSGSYQHRAAAYHSFTELTFTQNPLAIFLGNGFLSTSRVFDDGLLQSDGFRVVDNELVLMQSQGGLVCLLLLLALVATAFWHAEPRLRPAIFAVVFAMLVFDTMLSQSATALTFLLFGLAGAHREGGHHEGGLDRAGDMTGPAT